MNDKDEEARAAHAMMVGSQDRLDEYIANVQEMERFFKVLNGFPALSQRVKLNAVATVAGCWGMLSALLEIKEAFEEEARGLDGKPGKPV